MNKIKLIIAREYLTRVKKKSFIIMTILAPVFMAALLIVPAVITKKTLESQKKMNVLVIDDNLFFINKLGENMRTTFTYRSGDINEFKKEIFTGDYDAILHIPKGGSALRANLYYEKDPPSRFVPDLESQLDKQLFDKLLMDTFNIQLKQFEALKKTTQSKISSIKIDEQGNEKTSFAEISKIVGIFAGVIIYFFIFLCAQQVLRGVLEEKTNRIVEVLISSVKPMQLMLGKIIGVAMVGLTQFLAWIVLTFILIIGVQIAVPNLLTPEPVMMTATQIQMSDNTEQLLTDSTPPATPLLEQIQNYFNFSFSTLLLCFLFYFLFGYLIYASLYAAIGSAVDTETDSQQFLLPVTIPLILAIMMVMPISESPNGSLALWMSMIPLTSPVAMLIRLPAGVPLHELLISMGLCIAFFLFCVWLAAKIYRIGIIMYGKKITWKDLGKWLKYSFCFLFSVFCSFSIFAQSNRLTNEKGQLLWQYNQNVVVDEKQNSFLVTFVFINGINQTAISLRQDLFNSQIEWLETCDVQIENEDRVDYLTFNLAPHQSVVIKYAIKTKLLDQELLLEKSAILIMDENFEVRKELISEQNFTRNKS